jgi:isoleucyl-tRNA synthetase
MDDYNVCMALNVPAFAPVDDAGAFTKDAFPEQPEVLEGLPVADIKKTGSNAVCKYLETLNMLRGKYNYRHKYPIDWRTKEPVITRATEQWFANVEGIKDASMKAIANVSFMPVTGRSRLESFIQGRSQWCISRQRAWGVPIPALYKVEGETLIATMDSEVIDHVVGVIKERGIDAWWTDTQDDPAWKPKHLTGTYIRGRDTMDVWFDSGTSWTLLPQEKDQPVADVYLEGTDQHRGWFQSSLLTHVATQPYTTETVKAPYKTLITHGFTLDSDGRKMSKSLGNVVSPSQIMSGELLPPVKRKKQKGAKQDPAAKSAPPTYDAMGADALRLWAASSDYTRDVTIGQPVLMSVNQALHKYRVTFKWLLGIFSLSSCPPPFASFNALTPNTEDFNNITDRLAVHRLAQVSAEVHAYFDKYEFFKGVNTINKYISQDLSAFYFETLKDRVYTGSKSDCETLQHVLGLIFYELLQMLAPVCPLLVEEVWEHVPQPLRDSSLHPGRATWTPMQTPTSSTNSSLESWSKIISTLTPLIKTPQERLRADKKIGSSLECGVTLYLSCSAARNFLTQFGATMHPCNPSVATMQEQLAALFVVSEFNVGIVGGDVEPALEFMVEDDLEQRKLVCKWWEEERGMLGEEEVNLVVHPPGNEKCPRCWRFVKEEGEEVCGRCSDVVTKEVDVQSGL